jgi:hypothetical protein
VADDCASAVCTGATCQAPRCDDKVKNGSESDTDCGTGCTLCAVGQACLTTNDCTSGVCTSGKCAPQLHAELATGDPSDSTNTPHPYFQIVNDSKVSVPLHELTLRYYYSKEPAGTEVFNCYYVTNDECPELSSASFSDFSPKTPTADRVLQLGFVASAPTLAAKQTVEIRGAFNVPSYDMFDQTNDYSFAVNTDFAVSQRVTVYRNGVLVWGTEP